jgi:putative membrane protein
MADIDKSAGEMFRLRLQLEMTLLVWVRTSLALMGFGFVVARFGLFLREIAEAGHINLRNHPHLAVVSSSAGTFLIVLGVIVLLVAAATHYLAVGHLERGELAMPKKLSLGVILSLVLAALGMAMAIYLTLVEL